MAEVLSASDIVFGKAGPNFLFNVVACKKPFVAITHVGGQEDGNLDIIRKKKGRKVSEEEDSSLISSF
jgi:UDP-N-acetylglucosamine:LPS N-acetylglucosamine transferase